MHCARWSGYASSARLWQRKHQLGCAAARAALQRRATPRAAAVAARRFLLQHTPRRSRLRPPPPRCRVAPRSLSQPGACHLRRPYRAPLTPARPAAPRWPSSPPAARAPLRFPAFWSSLRRTLRRRSLAAACWSRCTRPGVPTAPSWSRCGQRCRLSWLARQARPAYGTERASLENMRAADRRTQRASLRRRARHRHRAHGRRQVRLASAKRGVSRAAH